jgi:hypothetical protein
VDNVRLGSSSISPILNGLSDHDAQFLTINNTVAITITVPIKQRTRKINDTIMQFQLLLENEASESIKTMISTEGLTLSCILTYLLT